MNAKKTVLLIALLLVSITVYITSTQKVQHDDLGVKAFIMLNRYGSSSDPTAMVTITDEILKEYPVLRDAFQVEFLSNAVGKVHPSEWVICSLDEGKEIEELIGSLLAVGEGDRRLEYLGEKFMLWIEYGTETPIIS